MEHQKGKRHQNRSRRLRLGFRGGGGRMKPDRLVRAPRHSLLCARVCVSRSLPLVIKCRSANAQPLRRSASPFSNAVSLVPIGRFCPCPSSKVSFFAWSSSPRVRSNEVRTGAQGSGRGRFISRSAFASMSTARYCPVTETETDRCHQELHFSSDF